MNGHWPPTPGFEHAPQGQYGKFWQENHAPIGVQEKFYPVSWLQTEMVTNCFRNGRLTFDGNSRFHMASITFTLM